MNWGGPEFVLAIIAMGMFAGVAKSWIRAKNGLPDEEPREGRRHRRHRQQDESEKVQALRSENRRLTDRLEASEDRLAVLERIVTDRGYGLAEEIEALRDRPARREDAGVPLNIKDREEA